MRQRHAQPEPFRERGRRHFAHGVECQSCRRAKLVIIHDDPKMVGAGRRLFGRSCDMPDGIPHVTSLEQAKALVDSHRPDIVLVGKRIDGEDPEAHYHLLAHIKSRRPGTKVAVWSEYLTGDENREFARYRFDATLSRDDTGGMLRFVRLCSG